MNWVPFIFWTIVFFVIIALILLCQFDSIGWSSTISGIENYIPDMTTYSNLENTKNNKLLNIYQSKLGSFFRNKMDNIRTNYKDLGYTSDADIGDHIYVHNDRYIYDPMMNSSLSDGDSLNSGSAMGLHKSLQIFQPSIPSHDVYTN